MRLSRGKERITNFRSSIAELISDCNKVIPRIDNVLSAIEEVERLKLSAAQQSKRIQAQNPHRQFLERLENATKPIYERISQVRQDRIYPVIGPVRQLFRAIESILQRYCHLRDDLIRLRDAILSFEYFKMAGPVDAIDWKKVRDGSVLP